MQADLEAHILSTLNRKAEMAETTEEIDLSDSGVQDTITIVAGQFMIGAAMSQTPDSDMGHVLNMIAEATGGSVEVLIYAGIRAIQSIIATADLDIADVGQVGAALIDTTSSTESDGQ